VLPARDVATKSARGDAVTTADFTSTERIVDALDRSDARDSPLCEDYRERHTAARGSSTASTARRTCPSVSCTTPLASPKRSEWTRIAWPGSTWCSTSVRVETFRAVDGGRRGWAGCALRVRFVRRAEQAIVATEYGYTVEGPPGADRRDTPPGVRDVRSGGSSALDLAWVAGARLHG
jgi:fructose-1,6-bisphosphatase/inositol monophosphatase family enzyme